MTYCPRCASTFTNKDTYLLCPTCSYEWYFNPKPCNAAILVDQQGKILFLRRNSEPSKGLLDLPGGFIEYHESAEESLQRELAEEVGFTAENLTYLGSFADQYPFQGEDLQTLGIVFTGVIPDHVDTATLQSDEATEIVFLYPKDINPEDLAFKSIGKALDMVKTRL